MKFRSKIRQYVKAAEDAYNNREATPPVETTTSLSMTPDYRKQLYKKPGFYDFHLYFLHQVFLTPSPLS